MFWTAAVVVPLLFLGVFFAWPVVVMVGKGFVVDGQLDLSGFADVFGRPRTWRIIGLTLAQAIARDRRLRSCWACRAPTCCTGCSFRGRAVVRALVTVPFVLPTVVVGVAFRSLLVDGGPLGFLQLDGTFAAIVAALVFFNYAVVVRTVGGLWERLDPRAEQAARALGASPWQAFRTVTLPSLTPAIASAASLVFLFCATAFGTVLVLGGLRFGTIETEIWIQTTQFLDLRAAAVLSVVQLVVVAGVLVVAGRAGRDESARCALSRAGAAVRPLSWRRPAGCRPATGTRSRVAAALVTAVVVLLIATPLVNLVVRSLRTPRAGARQLHRARRPPAAR